jgi:hypothetical protein
MALIDQSSPANARITLGGLTVVVASIVALRNLSGPDLQGLAQTQFGATFQDGLGATYIWNASDSTPDNGSTVIAPYVGPATGRWNALATTAPAASSTVSVATIAALKAIATPNASITYLVQGYYAPGDGGGGSFTWNAASTATDNGGTIIKATSVTTGRFNLLYTGSYDLRQFGARGVGGDDTASIQSAVNALNATGGRIYCSSGQYGLSSTIQIASQFPIYLDGDGGWTSQNLLAVSSCFVALNALPNGMIRWQTPNGNRNDSGGGGIQRCAFTDATPRTNAVTAALNLVDFNLSYVRDCYFHELLGSAIVTDFCVMSSIDRCVIRYCGNTGAYALSLGTQEIDDNHVTQSTTVRDCRLEVNYGASYIYMYGASTANQDENKILLCGFEADPNTPATNQIFIECASHEALISQCHFNNNLTTQLKISGYGNVVQGITSKTNLNTAARILVTGTQNIIDGVFCEYGVTELTSIELNGPFNFLSNVLIEGCGSIVCDAVTGQSNTLSNIQMYNCNTSDTDWIKLVDGCQLIGGRLQLVSPATTSANGVRVDGTCPHVADVDVVGFTTTVSLDNHSADAMIHDCCVYNNSSGVAYQQTQPGSVVHDCFGFLAGTVTFTPGTVNSGAAVVFSSNGVTVPGAVAGDFVQVSTPQTLLGCTISGYVAGTNLVYVVISNNTGANQTFGSSTFKVKVTKNG